MVGWLSQNQSLDLIRRPSKPNKTEQKKYIFAQKNSENFSIKNKEIDPNAKCFGFRSKFLNLLVYKV